LLFKQIGRDPFNWKPFLTRGLIFLAGVTLPFILTCLVLFKAGVFDRFWFWTVDYARQYVSSVPFSIGISNLGNQLGRISTSALLIWITAAIGLASFIWNSKSQKHLLFVALFSVFSFLAVFPGFYFRPHYFVLLLPAVALLAGLGAESLFELFSRIKAFPATRLIPVLLILIVLLHGVWQQREFLFYMDPVKASRMTYGLNPFPESLEIARFIRENSKETDRIAVIGSEPQIYFYSNRHSATGHIYTYALMEAHPYALSMQKEMIKEIEYTKPEFIVFVNIWTSWLIRGNSETLIFDWFNSYSKQYYDLVGIVDIGDEFTKYRWHEDSTGYRAQSTVSLSIFRRKD